MTGTPNENNFSGLMILVKFLSGNARKLSPVLRVGYKLAGRILTQTPFCCAIFKKLVPVLRLSYGLVGKVLT